MKYLFLLIISLLMSSTIAQIDSLKKNSISLNIEVGMPTSIFFGNGLELSLGQRSIYRPFTDYIPPHILALTLERNNSFSLGIKYHYFEKTTSVNNKIQGDVILRRFHLIDLGLSRNVNFKKLQVSPTINLSMRIDGMESVLITYIPGSWNEPVTSSFKYSSIGTGIGLKFNYPVYRKLYIAGNMSFFHFFEKNKLLGKPHGGFEEFYNKYHVNRDILTLSLNIGYRINIRK